MVNKKIDTWTDFKDIMSIKHIQSVQVQSEDADQVHLFFVDEGVEWYHELDKTIQADYDDYVANYEPDKNKSMRPTNYEGKLNTVSSSRPMGTKTTFASRADSAAIGEGVVMAWDFADTDNDVTADPGRKKKQIDLTFKENVWIKEGCVYFHNMPKGTFCHMSVWCPAGGYVILPDGTPVQVPVDTMVSKYVIHHFIQGSCPMGDELNTEEAQENPIPPGYFVRLEVDGPEHYKKWDEEAQQFVQDGGGDKLYLNFGNGYVSFELYRKETI